ncbi:MAG: DUF885 domain-containing protein, partial [Myxococcales bacterium]|nr:DUF885 domain-containing protein [Myxococcales bacterium]
PAPGPLDKEGAASDFATYREDLVDRWLVLTPRWGRQMGLHDFDAKLFDHSPAGRATYRDFLKEAQRQLRAFDGLSEDDALDRAILLSRAELALFELDTWRIAEQNPRFYTELFDVASYVDFDYAPLEERFERLVDHEQAALQQAGQVLASLDAVLSRPVVETAIKVYRGYASYLRGDLLGIVKGVGSPELQKRFGLINAALADAADDIAGRLDKEWLPRADQKQHVLGEERYLAFIQAQEGQTVDLEAFRAMAEKDLARNKAAYVALKGKVTMKRPAASELLDAATALMDDSRKFVSDHALVTIPSEDRCKLKETPPYMQWNAAFLNMPGPFDRAKEAFYYITLPNPSWSKKEQVEYIFPYGVLSSTTVHEVYPGHFLHGLWIRAAKTRVQKMSESYSFTEGWAHYVEEMMIEEGWAEGKPERHLGQLSDALLRNCRFVASIAIHAGGASLDDVAKRFQDDCFQDKATAREQAVRGTFDPGYFAYTLGKLQIMELRESLKAELGERFSLQRFHDALMGYGAPPIALIRDRVAERMRQGR